MDKYLTVNGEINLNAVANDFVPHQSVRRVRAADVKTGKELYKLIGRLVEGTIHRFYNNYNEAIHGNLPTVYTKTATVSEPKINFRPGT